MMKTLLYPFFSLLIGFGIYNTAKADIHVISPNGGETWVNGSSSLISFTNTGSESYFIIEFSDDGGANWYEADYVYAYTGLTEYNFYGSFNPTTQGLIRVSDYYYASIHDESDSTFTVEDPDYYIYYPQPGDEYYPGEEIFVNWYSENSDPVNIDFSSDNGISWTSVGTSVPGDYFFSFPAPSVVSNLCQVRVTSNNDNTFSTISGTFSILNPPTITLTSPNGGETWEFGEYYTISWTGENLDYYVMIEFSNDGGNTWTQQWWAQTESSGGSTQVSPPMIPTENARIRVSDYYYSQASDASDADFTVISPAYLVYYPSEGTSYYANEELMVQWNTAIEGNVNIEISTDNGNTFQTLLSDVPAYSYESVTLPSTASDNCIIKVVSSDNPELFGLSGTFRIVPLPVLTLTFPAGGEILDNDSTYQITWNLTGELLYYYYYFTVDFSSDNGSTWQNIGWISDIQNQNSIEWRTPTLTSDQCLVRISDYYYNNSNISAISQSPFSIKDFPRLDICMVSVDSASGHNVIIWNKVDSELISEYVVLKETTEANQYVEVGSVPASALAVITDNNSNPGEKATRYKLTFRDAQGNLFPTSSLHQTIHLSINKGVGDTWNLYWNQYLGFPVASYNIYRGTSPNDLTMIGTVSGNFTSYTDQNSGPGFVYYMVEVLNPNDCNPTNTKSSEFSKSRSNIATNKVLGVGENYALSDFTVYPNPASRVLKVKTDLTIRGKALVSIYSSSGKQIKSLVAEGNQLSTGYELNISDLSEGIYIMKITASETTSVVKFTKGFSD